MRILSGIQPSGDLHIGNYFGMMKPMIRYQEEEELYCFVVNFHALTTVIDGEILRKNTINAVIDFLALGLDPSKSIFWVQSDVPEVTELTWYLSNVTPLALLERSHSYKDKIAKGILPNHGLFTYPVLMASDILLYQAEKVPVGKDQKQHVEITRDIAVKFNSIYGDTFILPEPEINPNVAVIPGIDGQKMSKSYGNTIEIFSEEKKMRKKVMSIVTDSTPVGTPKEPSKCTLFAIYTLFASKEEQESLANKYRAGEFKYSEVKKELFERIWNYYAPYRNKRNELVKNLDYVYKVIKAGAEKAREKALPTIEKVRNRVGSNYLASSFK
ncbi:MAG: tryptophan--tRNA ligase [bacterium]